MLELGGRVVAQPGVDLGRLDDRARRRHEPVEPLALAEPGDRARRGSPPAIRSIAARCVSIVAGSTSGASARSRARSSPTRAARNRFGRQSRTTPAFRHSPRSTRGTTRMIAYWNGCSASQAAAAARAARPARRTAAAPRAGGRGRRRRPARWAAASPMTGSARSQSSGSAATRSLEQLGGDERCEPLVRGGDRRRERQQDVVGETLGVRPTGVRVGVAPGVVDVERRAVVDQPGRPCQTSRFGFFGERSGFVTRPSSQTTAAAQSGSASRRRPG